MQNKIKDMTHGNPMGLILKFSLPLMVGSVFQQLYMIIDTIIVGRGVGVTALASLGAADWINWLMLWTIHGFTHGFSVRVALDFGAGDKQGLRKTVTAIIKLCIIWGILLTFSGWFVIEPLLRLLRTEPILFIGARTYLQVQFGGTLLVIAYNMAAAILRCLGDSRTPLMAMVIAAIVNIALDLLFVLVFKWGIFGAAFATVIAQGVSFVYCIYVMRTFSDLHLKIQDWQKDNARLAHLCKLGIPVALQNAIIAVGGMVVQYVLNGFGLIFVAGFTATNKLYGVLESVAIAFGYAMTAYMGQNRGARRVDRIDDGMRSVVGISMIFSSAISVFMLLFGKRMLGLFISSTEKNAEDIMQVAHHYLMIMSLLLIFLFFIHAYRSSLQGLGYTLIPALSGVVELIMRIGTALLLPIAIGAEGIFYAEIAAWIGAALILMIYYYRSIEKIKLEIESV